MNNSSDSEKLANPATYLHAALRAFVSSAYERVTNLLNNQNVFNFGPGTPYPDIQTLRKKLEQAVDYWRGRNAFIADLIKSTLIHSAGVDESNVTRKIFLPLTNYFFCYIKVDRRRRRAVSTVRVLFPVDFDCNVCPIKENSRELCFYSCFRFAFFPHKPEEMINKYDGHYLAAQFALADASFAATVPDINGGRMSDSPLAALMVPLLFGESLLLTDASAEREEYRLSVRKKALSARCRFNKMNEELGIRSEAFLPIKVARPFMPGFYAGLSSGGEAVNTPPQEWVPDFPNSSPFCIELYSPAPDWFAHAHDGDNGGSSSQREYIFQNSPSDPIVRRNTPPTPRIYSVHQESQQDESLRAAWNEIRKVLALGFNLQHYSELMAGSFVDWLRTMFTDSAFDPFTPTLRRRYQEFLAKGPSKPMPPEVEEFLTFVRSNPGLLAEVLNEIHHGMLLHPNIAPPTNYDLSSIEHIRLLAKEVDGATIVEELDYEQTPYCEAPLNIGQLSESLREYNKTGVLSRLVAEVIKNHNRKDQKNAIRFHTCLDPDQHRFSLHFCSPGVHIDLRTYLNLRQGLPHLRHEHSQQYDQLRGSGIGLALSRVIAEEQGFEYVIGLGRDENCTPAQPDLHGKIYRKDFHTRIYVGGAL